MDGRIANEEEAEEWGQNELEATLIGARKASKKKANADARSPVVPLVLSHSSSHPSPSNRDISAPFDHRLTPFFFRYSCFWPGDRHLFLSCLACAASGLHTPRCRCMHHSIIRELPEKACRRHAPYHLLRARHSRFAGYVTWTRGPFFCATRNWIPEGNKSCYKVENVHSRAWSGSRFSRSLRIRPWS